MIDDMDNKLLHRSSAQGWQTLWLWIIPLIWGGVMLSVVLLRLPQTGSVSYLAERFTFYEPDFGTFVYSITREDERVGYMMTSFKESTSGEAAYELIEDVGFYRQSDGLDLPLRVQFQQFLGEEFELMSIKGTLALGGMLFAFDGEREGDQLRVKMEGLDQTREAVIDYRQEAITSRIHFPWLATHRWQRNEKAPMPVMDWFAMEQTEITYEYLGRDQLADAFGKFETMHFATSQQGLQGKMWIDLQGKLQREEVGGYVSQLAGFDDVRDKFQNILRTIADLRGEELSSAELELFEE